MTVNLVLARVGAGKTEAVQERIAALKRVNPLAKIWVLLASERQIATFRQRLMARQPERRVYANIDFFNFYNLYSHLLATAGRPQRCLNDAARYGLLRAVCATEDLQVFHRIAHTSGFIRIMAEFIYELKQNLITPEALFDAAGSEKERELARIYAAYQRWLQQQELVDREGQGWLALEALFDFPHLASDVNLLLVDGYDQFNVLQAKLLALLGARVGESLVTLTTVPGREETIGRRFARARQRLHAVHAELGLPLDEDVRTGFADTRHPALQHLSQYVFLPRAPVYAPHPAAAHRQDATLALPLHSMERGLGGEVSTPPLQTTPLDDAAVQLTLPFDNVGGDGKRTQPSSSAPSPSGRRGNPEKPISEVPLPEGEGARTKFARVRADDALHLIEAPDMAREVGAALRRVKALLLSGCRPDDILIALRDWTSYGGYFAAQGRTYGLPLALHYGEPLAQNPAVAALLSLLELHMTDFRRRELLDVLRSPYFTVPGMTPASVDLLDRLSLTMMVTGGRETWLEALEAAKAPVKVASDDDDETPSPFNKELVEDTQVALNAFFDAVRPPREESTEGYVRWLEALIGRDVPDPEAEEPEAEPTYNLSLLARAREGAAPGIVERDMAALHELASGLRGMIAAAALFNALGYAPRVTWGDFFTELKTIVAGASVRRSMARDGRVLVTTVADARGLPHKHLFIVGLSEGVFPAPAPEDPLLLDSERAALARRGIELSMQAERDDDDGLFYELVNQAHDSLTLSRPYTKDGSPWPESHLWRAVRALFPDVPVDRYKVGAVVPADEAATPHEVALAAAGGIKALRPWLAAAYPDYWERITLGQAIERGRISRQPYDHYAGRLRDERLIARAAEFLSPNRVWSATQLNEYGVCGFRFFARRLLRLEALKEPEDGMDIRQLGTLNHEILEATYQTLAQAGLTVTPEYADFAVQALHQNAALLLANAPQRLGFRASALWNQEKEALLRRLEALVRLDFSGSGPIDKAFPGETRRPYHFEVVFGGDEPLEIPLEAESLRVSGKIDRVDWQGNRAIVIDYKTGSTKIPTDEIKRGRNFQMMLYLLAANALFEADEIGGVFLHLGKGELSGKMLSSSEVDQETITHAKAHITRNLARGRAGDFATLVNRLDEGKCTHYCDFFQMCRMAIMPKNKREL